MVEECGKALREFILAMGREAVRHQLVNREAFPAEILEAVTAAAPGPEPAPAPGEVVSAVVRAVEERSTNDPAVLYEALSIRSIKRRKSSVLHLVAAADFPFAGALPWANGDLFVVSVAD